MHLCRIAGRNPAWCACPQACLSAEFPSWTSACTHETITPAFANNKSSLFSRLSSIQLPICSPTSDLALPWTRLSPEPDSRLELVHKRRNALKVRQIKLQAFDMAFAVSWRSIRIPHAQDPKLPAALDILDSLSSLLEVSTREVHLRSGVVQRFARLVPRSRVAARDNGDLRSASYSDTQLSAGRSPRCGWMSGMSRTLPSCEVRSAVDHLGWTQKNIGRPEYIEQFHEWAASSKKLQNEPMVGVPGWGRDGEGVMSLEQGARQNASTGSAGWKAVSRSRKNRHDHDCPIMYRMHVA